MYLDLPIGFRFLARLQNQIGSGPTYATNRHIDCFFVHISQYKHRFGEGFEVQEATWCGWWCGVVWLLQVYYLRIPYI